MKSVKNMRKCKLNISDSCEVEDDMIPRGWGRVGSEPLFVERRTGRLDCSCQINNDNHATQNFSVLTSVL